MIMIIEMMPAIVPLTSKELLLELYILICILYPYYNKDITSTIITIFEK